MIILRDREHTDYSTEAAAHMLQQWLASCDAIEQQKEHLFVILLDSKGTIVCVDLVTIGTLDSTIMHPREVFVRALQEHASYIVTAHNHPSNECEPSNEDEATVSRILSASILLGIPMIDHLIVCMTTFLSFKTEGIM